MFFVNDLGFFSLLDDIVVHVTYNAIRKRAQYACARKAKQSATVRN